MVKLDSDNVSDTWRSSRLSAALRRSIENMDEDLCKFERNFLSSGSYICWATDYNDVFDQLKIIFKAGNYHSAVMLDEPKGGILEEIGLPYFLEDEKMTISPEGQVQIMVPDLMVADTGALLLAKDFGYLDFLHNHKPNIFITSIDRIIGSVTYAEGYSKMLEALQLRDKGQQFTLFSGSPHSKTYLFIVDNQRTQLLAQKLQRQALSCVQCGRCEEVCPVDKIVGKEFYDNVFTGPIGRVVLPFLENVEDYQRVVNACTMCGRCEEVCPIGLPLRDMIIVSRRKFFKEGLLDGSQASAVSKYKKYVTNRVKLNKPAWWKQSVLSKYLSHDFKEAFKPLHFEDKTFNQQNTENQ